LLPAADAPVTLLCTTDLGEGSVATLQHTEINVSTGVQRNDTQIRCLLLSFGLTEGSSAQNDRHKHVIQQQHHLKHTS